VVYRQNFTGGGVLNDDFGHGTHVAGIVGGNGSSSDQPGAFRTFKGIAPNANILDLRVLDQNGASTDSVVIAAIEKAVALKSQYNMRVINLSLGRPISRAALKIRCARKWKRPGKLESWWWWPPETKGATDTPPLRRQATARTPSRWAP
jgi:subtilisin family serine protease